MLVLSRKIGERILVPHCELSVTVLGIEGNTVRLGVAAPAEIGVYREELWQRVRSKAAPQDPIVTRADGGESRSDHPARSETGPEPTVRTSSTEALFISAALPPGSG